MNDSRQLGEPRLLIFTGKVDSRFLQRIPGAAQYDALELPELEQSRIGPVRRRKQDACVEK
jgi:hypothetical protein